MVQELISWSHSRPETNVRFPDRHKETNHILHHRMWCFSSPPEPLLAAMCPTQRGDLCNTFPRPDGGVEGQRSIRNLPEQSAASRCRLIVSESWGSSEHVPALPEWKQISSFTPALSRERASKLRDIIDQAQNKGGRGGWSRQQNKCTFVRMRRSHNASQSYWWQNTLDNHNHA